MMRINLALFVTFIGLLFISRFIDFTPKSISIPEATEVYKDKYTILDKQRVSLRVKDSSRSVVMVIIDAWGTPLDQNLLVEDFAIFKGIPVQYAIHNRLRNRTLHAERVEIKEDFEQIAFEQIDSLLTDSTYKRIATTIHPSQDGNRECLHQSLNIIAELMAKYPEVIFIVQGAHRPILGTPETRKMYYAHWVPVVIGNYKLP